MNETDQTLLLAASGVILLGTMTAFIVQWWRNRGRDDE